MTNREYLQKLSAHEFVIQVTFGFHGRDHGGCEAWLNQEREPELNACPFCGKYSSIHLYREDEITPELREVSTTPWSWAVNCDFNKGGCGATSGYMRTKEKAVEAWNRRA